ncbi:MAG: cobyrinate a,c-diamide synthase [Eggerthellaceae bacterium]|nr:cobyrinate a,c-diamide synthase [Eggerthellaceae bacterium]
MSQCSTPRILISAVSSGSGKTTITSGLLRCLTRRGMKLEAYKCGPDYIDPMFHKRVLDTPCRNLDLFFSTEDEVRTLLGQSSQSADLAVLEGVMGFYDGLGGTTTQASAYHVAKATQTPVVLIADGRGTSLTLASVIKGVQEFREQSHIAGVIVNRCSKSAFSLISRAVETECKVPVLGFVPVEHDAALESRHLGLITADEVTDLQARIDKMADLLEDSVDIDRFIAIARDAEAFAYDPLEIEPVVKNAPVIAVAHDNAFCFYYEESLERLHQLGATLVDFSPLHDDELPKVADALYLGGGYPELYAEQLSANESMRSSVKRAYETGMPIFAECGGFLYLKERLTDMDGDEWPQAGILPGGAHYTGKLSRFGYIELTAQQAGFAAQPGETFRAHEFHYYDSDENGTAFHAQKPLSKRNWDCCYSDSHLFAGFPHLYLPAAPRFAENFVRAASAFKEAKE